MKTKTQKSIVLKRKFKNLMSILLPIAKKVISNQLNKIKSPAMHKIKPHKIQNTFKRVLNRRITSLENKFSIKATKNIINKPTTVIEKSPIVVKPNIVTPSPEIVDKPKIVIEKSINYDE